MVDQQPVTRLIEFEVPGIPQQQGSKRALPVRNRPTKVVMVDMNAAKLAPWRKLAIAAAQDAMSSQPPIRGAVELSVTFVFPRLLGHFGTGRRAGVLKPGAPRYKTSAPDLSKLVRAIEDVLTQAGVYGDDALIARYGEVTKVYGDRPRVVVQVSEL